MHRGWFVRLLNVDAGVHLPILRRTHISRCLVQHFPHLPQLVRMDLRLPVSADRAAVSDASPEYMSVVESPVNMPSIPWDPTFFTTEICC